MLIFAQTKAKNDRAKIRVAGHFNQHGFQRKGHDKLAFAYFRFFLEGLKP